MATLYRPKIVEYRMPDVSNRTPEGKRVDKDTTGAVKSKRPPKKWYGRYTAGAGHSMRVPCQRGDFTPDAPSWTMQGLPALRVFRCGCSTRVLACRQCRETGHNGFASAPR